MSPDSLWLESRLVLTIEVKSPRVKICSALTLMGDVNF